SDSTGGIYAEEGIDPDAAAAHKEQGGTVVGLGGTKNITNDELLHTECDVLIPAAFENQIRADNVDGVTTKLIAEAANGPTTPSSTCGRRRSRWRSSAWPRWRWRGGSGRDQRGGGALQSSRCRRNGIARIRPRVSSRGSCHAGTPIVIASCGTSSRNVRWSK